jgi:hypothetical protein
MQLLCAMAGRLRRRKGFFISRLRSTQLDVFFRKLAFAKNRVDEVDGLNAQKRCCPAA